MNQHLISKKKRHARTDEELQQVAKAYDFKRTNRFTKEYLNLFESVYDNYARILSNSLFLRFRVNMKVKLDNIFQTTYLEYVMNLPTDAVSTVYTMFPVKGPLCLTFDSRFAFLALDATLGGSFTNRAPMREFSDVEKGVFRIVSYSFVESQAQCWQDYGRVDPAIRSVEFNPVLMQMAPDDESLLILEFTIEANDEDYPLKIAIPYSSIENMSDIFQLVRHHEEHIDEIFPEVRKSLDHQVKAADVDFKVILGEAQLPLEKVEGLKIGDVIKLDRRIVGDFLEAKVANQTRFKVQPGLVKDQVSVQVAEILDIKEY